MKNKHRLSNIDGEKGIATCLICGESAPIKLKARGANKGRGWCCKKARNDTINRLNKKKKRPYLKYRKSSCQRCGFIPELMQQLDVHHRDGNHENNSPSNLQTLC